MVSLNGFVVHPVEAKLLNQPLLYYPKAKLIQSMTKKYLYFGKQIIGLLMERDSQHRDRKIAKEKNYLILGINVYFSFFTCK